jgi:serine/threonine-protein kinase
VNTSPENLQSALSGRYDIGRELGQGDMATVYLATDVRHDRKVALKVLRPELAAVIGAERFLAEIKTTASLQHPHILPLHDSGEANGTVFYVMPYVEGESLELERYTPFDISVDGKQFLMAKRVSGIGAQGDPIVMTENWFEELRRITRQ